MRWLLWLYPRGWRRRYGDEFAALLEQEQPSPSLVLDVVLGALDAHLHRPEATSRLESGGPTMKHARRRTAWLVGIASLILVVALGAWLYGPAADWRTSSAAGNPNRVYLVLQADLRAVPAADQPASLQQARQIAERRGRAAGAADVSVRADGPDRLIVELGGTRDVGQAARLLTTSARLEFREEVDRPDGTREWVAARGQTTSGQEAVLSGQYVSQATVGTEPGTNRPLVLFELDPEGRQILATLTERIVGRRLGIFVDDQLLVALTVRDPIDQGRGQITGTFTAASAQELAVTLTSGTLPVPLEVVEARAS
jgi:hypothetical protein